MKKFICLALSLIIISSITFFTFALSKIPDNITEKAKISVRDFITTLESQRENYGLNEQDDVKKITLGEGYEVNKISVSALEKSAKSTSNDSISNDLIKKDGTYIYPIKIGNKCAGIAMVKNESVTQISSYTTFESEIEEAKLVVKKETGKADLTLDDNVKLIYDMENNVAGLSMKSNDGEYLVPLHDDSFVGFKKGIKKSLSETSKMIIKVNEVRKPGDSTIYTGIGGTNNTEDKKTSSNIYLYIGIIVFIVAIIGILFFRKKAVGQN